MTPSREADGISVARGKWRAIIHRCVKDPVRREYIVNCVSRIVKYELRKLCSDSFSSVLLCKNVEAITCFEWNNVLKEAEEVMPVLLQVLRKCTETPTKRNNTDAVIGVIISILAKHRRPHCSLLQKVISLVLYSGHCSKKVYIVL